LSLALTGNFEEIRIATCSNHSKAGYVNFKLPFESSFSTFSCNETHLKISVKLKFEKFVIIYDNLMARCSGDKRNIGIFLGDICGCPDGFSIGFCRGSMSRK